MYTHAPVQQAYNEPTTRVRYLLFNLQGYGSEVNYAQNMVAIPKELQRVPEIVKLTTELYKEGWYVQIGIIK